MHYSKTYSTVVRYGAKEIKEARFGTNLTKELGAMVQASITGENTPLLALADRLDEMDHPAANIVRQAGSGQHEIEVYNTWKNPINYFDNENIRTRGQTEHSLVPSAHIIFPYGENSLHPGTALAELRYLHHPTGHYWNLRLRSAESLPDNPNRRFERQFIIPTTPEEVTEFANQMKEADPDFSEHILKTLNATESEPNGEPE